MKQLQDLCTWYLLLGPYPERLVMGMDIEPHELIAILTLLCASQCQFVLILDSIMKGQRRIGNQSPHLRHQIRQLNFFRLIHEDDLACWESTRMDRRGFAILCTMLRTTGGLSVTQYVDVEEMIAIVLHILAHGVKNKVIWRHISKSGETMSGLFKSVLNAILRLHTILLKTPEPVNNSCTDERWWWFQVYKIYYFLLTSSDG